jgi:hypothetical protein
LVGVTVKVAITGLDPLLTAIKEGIEPTPLDAMPMLALLFIQGNELAFPIMLTVPLGVPLHSTGFITLLRVGVGITVI